MEKIYFFTVSNTTSIQIAYCLFKVPVVFPRWWEMEVQEEVQDGGSTGCGKFRSP